MLEGNILSISNMEDLKRDKLKDNTIVIINRELLSAYMRNSGKFM